MKAAVLNSIAGGFEIEDVLIGEPRGYEVLVEVRAAGLCHSDLHLAESDYGIPLPAVLGHELAGVVMGVGSEVKDFALLNVASRQNRAAVDVPSSKASKHFLIG